MTEVGLGEKVESVRAKVGLGNTDLLNAWRTVNVRVCRFSGRLSSHILFLPQTKAQEISHRMNGNVPSKQANTYSTIDELKEYFAQPKAGGDEKARLKIIVLEFRPGQLRLMTNQGSWHAHAEFSCVAFYIEHITLYKTSDITLIHTTSNTILSIYR